MEVSNPNLAKLIINYNIFFKKYKEVESILDLSEEKKFFFRKYEKNISQLEEIIFPVAFLGGFNTGKSTIINAFIGKEILPTANEITTAIPMLIKSGEIDNVRINYLDKEKIEYLLSLLTESILKRININDAFRFSLEQKDASFNHLSKKINEYESQSGNIVIKNELEKIKIILDNIDIYLSKKNEIKPIADLRKIDENSIEANFIDYIVITLKDINLPKNIILVDLPGLGVLNERHQRITSEYIQNEAKSFVVCIDPQQHLEGKELEFIRNLNNTNPSILKRAFWVFNKWDQVNLKQKTEATNFFNKKVYENNLNIDNSRVYSFSALRYLESKNKQQENEQTGNSIDDYIKNFESFKNNIINYLNTTAVSEYIKQQELDLYKITKDLIAILDKSNIHSTAEDDTQIRISDFTYDEFNSYISEINYRLDLFRKKIISETTQNFVTQQQQEDITRKINNSLYGKHDDLKLTLMSGQYNKDGMITNLLHDINQALTKENSIIENIFSIISLDFTEKYLSSILYDLIQINKNYITDNLKFFLDEKFSNNNLKMRLYGLSDTIFYKYNQKIEDIGLSLKEKIDGETVENKVEQTLNYYSLEINKFLPELINDLNKKIGFSLRNHCEYTYEETQKFIKSEEKKIKAKIIYQASHSKALEQQKNNNLILQTAFDQLNTMITSIL